MGRYGAYDLYIAPFVRDFSLFLPMFLSWFVVQWVISRVYSRLLGANFTGMPRANRQDIVVRTVSVCNGLLMIGAAVCFINDLRVHHFRFHNDQYKEVPGYRFFRVTIVSYFAWDIIVCYVYKWERLWKVHAIVSFVGAYLLSFPYSDHYGSYFTGMFELSNSPLHISSIIRTLNMVPLFPLATVMEGVFVLLFVVIRLVGGSIVTGSWMKQTAMNLVANYQAGGTLVHGEVPLVLSMVLVSVVQLLQYIWFVEITKRVIGMFKSSHGKKVK
ncbi:hypothetical protein DQ04_08361010 [Trypanosoma grayi]|uniref:hypothetical protein n=1 Tax=Trypanosoma grayi TaxID=71804 RepID=UPI0004F45D66|nr:hypothetical protein DQ04_08361010 [Trypanosoma grayi]KEG07965.1 hypothetical protein DQ04_08361010 [Trypanosoma grayi]